MYPSVSPALATVEKLARVLPGLGNLVRVIFITLPPSKTLDQVDHVNTKYLIQGVFVCV